MAGKRKAGDGTVRLRQDGRWEGRHVIGYDEKGLPQTKNVLAKTKKECLEKLSKLQEQCGVYKKEQVKPDMSFGAWMEYWYENCSKPKLRPSCQQNYESNINQHIIPELGDIQLNKLTQNDLQQFYIRTKQSGRKKHVQAYGEGLSNRTVRGCHSLCRAALEKAVADGLIRTNPAIGCKLPPKKTREMQVLTRDEMQRFLIQAQEEGYYELFLLDLATGMRRGELLALQWDDLNFETGELQINKQVYRVKGELTVSEPKTKASTRTIILPPTLLDILKEYKARVYSRWMFPSPRNEDVPLDPATSRKKLLQILEHAQCKRIRFHDLRHTFATTALEHGMDIKTLAATIGHVSVATTLDTYTHITNDMQQEAAANIDRGIGKNETPSTDESQNEPQPRMTQFTPYKGNRRRPGTGCVTQINDHLWEGRYSPIWIDGKKHSRNVYAHTREECEEKLVGLIADMKAELAQLKEAKKLAAQ